MFDILQTVVFVALIGSLGFYLYLAGKSPDALHTYRDKVLKEAWRWRRICRNITNKKNCGIRN